MFATFPSDWFPCAVWLPDSPLRMLGAIIIVIASCVTLLALLLFLLHLLNYGWRKEEIGRGIVKDKKSAFHPAETSATSDGDIIETSAYTSYQLMIHSYDGWTDLVSVDAEQFNRIAIDDNVRFYYQTGRLDGAPRLRRIRS